MDEKFFKDNFKENEKYTRWFSDDEIKEYERLTEKPSKSLVGDIDAFERAKRGDFSKFELLSDSARIYLASLYMRSNFEQLYNYVMKDYNIVSDNHIDTEIDTSELFEAPEDLAERKIWRRELAMNPLFRLAISVKTPDTELRNWFMENDSMFNREIMEDTLRPVSEEDFDTLRRNGMDTYDYRNKTSAQEKMRLTEDAVAETTDNIDKQTMMAKVMLLAHIGNCYTTDSTGERKAYEGNAANLFAHCSRVSVILPPGVDTGVIDSIMGKNRGSITGVYKRTAATHSVEPKKYDSSGHISQEFREVKTLITEFRNQYGMDVAIGGLGQDGISGDEFEHSLLRNDGTCGHMYIHAHEGGSNECGAMLIGFESDSPSAEGNQQGHTHAATINPKGEKMSSFCAQRTDEFGNKYGGRVIDLSDINPRELSSFINQFDEIYRGLQVKALDKDDTLADGKYAREQVEKINREVCGKIMDPGILAVRMCETGIRWENVRNVLEKGRNFRRFNEVTSGNIHIIPVDKVRQPDRKESEDYEEYRHSIGNRIRRRNGIPETMRRHDAKYYKDTEKQFNDILARFSAEAENDEVSVGNLYRRARPEDRQFIEKADAAKCRVGNVYGEAKNIAEAFAEEMKIVAENIGRLGMRKYSLDKIAEGVRIEITSLPEDIRQEFMASAQAFGTEAVYNKAEEQSKFEVLNKVMSITEGRAVGSLTESEEIYAREVLAKKGIDYNTAFKGKRFREALPEGEMTIHLGNEYGMTSTDSWRNASDRILEQTFANYFKSNETSNEQSDLMERDIYDNIFIVEKNGMHNEGVSMREKYGDNPKEHEAEFMRSLLNGEIDVVMASYDTSFQPHLSAVKLHSDFPEKQPTRMQRWRGQIPESENSKFDKRAERIKSLINDEYELRFTKRSLAPEMDVISNISKSRSISEYRKDLEKSGQIFDEEVKKSVARGKGMEEYNPEEINITACEVQLYMLSKGMSMADVMSVESRKEEKDRLAAEYYDLKLNADSAEYKAALERMKTTLAEASVPAIAFESDMNIINNLHQITWLKKASDLFMDDMAGEDSFVNRSIRNINKITGVQLDYMEFFNTKEFKNGLIGENKHTEYIKDFMRKKLFLEACTENNKGNFYSTVNVSEFEGILNADVIITKDSENNVYNWLSGKVRNDEKNTFAYIDKDGKFVVEADDNITFVNMNKKGKVIVGRSHNTPEMYGASEEGKIRNSVEKEYNEIIDKCRKNAKDKGQEIFANLMNEPAEKFLAFDAEDTAEKYSAEITKGIENVHSKIKKDAENFRDHYMHNSSIRVKSSILRQRPESERGMINGGSYNIFPVLTDKEIDQYNHSMADNKEKADNFVNIVERLDAEVLDTTQRDITNYLYEKINDCVRTTIFRNLLIKNILRPEGTADRVVDAVYKENAVEFDYDRSKLPEEICALNTKEDIEKYVKGHKEIKSIYEKLRKAAYDEFGKYKKIIDDFDKKLDKIKNEESKNTPALKDMIAADCKYVKDRNRADYEKNKIDVKKSLLAYSIEAYKESQIRKERREKEEEITFAPEVKETEIKTEVKAEPVKEVAEVPKMFEPGPSSEKYGYPTFMVEDVEVRDRETLENAKNRVKMKFMLNEWHQYIAEDNICVENMKEIEKLKSLPRSEAKTKQEKDFRKAYVSAMKTIEKEASKEGRAKASDEKHKYVKELKEKYKDDFGEISYIKDIEKSVRKMKAKAGKISDKTSQAYIKLQDKINFYDEAAKKGREIYSATKEKVRRQYIERESTNMLSNLYKKHFDITPEALDREYESLKEERIRLKEKFNAQRAEHQSKLDEIEKKGVEILGADMPVSRHSLSQFMPSREQTLRKAKAVRMNRHKEESKEEKPTEIKGNLQEFLYGKKGRSK